MSTRILEPGEIEPRSTHIPERVLPRIGGLFAARAARLRALVPGNALGAYLSFVAELADVQQWVADSVLLPAVAEAHHREQALAAGMVPLPAVSGRRPHGWIDVLRALLGRLAQAQLPDAVHVEIARLERRDSDWLDLQAAAILSGRLDGLDLASAPMIAAALQVIWAAAASGLDARSFGPLVGREFCPVCGSHPVAGVVRIGGDVAGFRYLHCALCCSEWHLVRVKCSACESTKGIDYREIEGGPGVVKAECCSECGSYLKQCYQHKAPDLDPVADDLASLSLDLLLDEQGFARSGTNLMLFAAPS